jgi:hypothetical protein
MKNYQKLLITCAAFMALTQVKADPTHYVSNISIQPNNLPADTYAITLHNATTCKVEMDNLTIVKKEAADPIDVYSFYYPGPAYQTRTYYSTVPAIDSATNPAIVIVGNGNPGMQPYPYDDIELGLAPSPNLGGASAFTATSKGAMRGYNGRYIIQWYNSNTQIPWCTENMPCLDIQSTNPCTTPATDLNDIMAVPVEVKRSYR